MNEPMPAAGLRRRAAAFGLDYALIAAWIALIVVVGIVVRLAAPTLGAWLFGGPIRGQLSGFLSLTLPVALYFALSEKAPRGATWGKQRLGLRLVTSDGYGVSLHRSILRTALRFLPWELTHAIVWRYAFPGSAPEGLLNAGLVVVWLLVAANIGSALVDRQRRTLYDRLSRTSVVRGNRPSRRPA